MTFFSQFRAECHQNTFRLSCKTVALMWVWCALGPQGPPGDAHWGHLVRFCPMPARTQKLYEKRFRLGINYSEAGAPKRTLQEHPKRLPRRSLGGCRGYWRTPEVAPSAPGGPKRLQERFWVDLGSILERFLIDLDLIWVSILGHVGVVLVIFLTKNKAKKRSRKLK